MIETFLFVRFGERGVVERSLEVTEVSRGVGGGDGDVKPDCTFFGRKIWNIDLTCLLVSLC